MPPKAAERRPGRRREARLLVAPFVEVLAVPHFEQGKSRPELVQDISRRALSFFTTNEALLARLSEVRSVALEGPRGFYALLEIGRAHARRLRPDGPVRVALEFADTRPAFRPPPSLRRVTEGYYAPGSVSEALQTLRVVLGFEEGSSAERRAADRIRVPLEQEIVVRLEADGRLVADALLADTSPRGLACYLDEPPARPPDRVTLLWRGKHLVTRRVERFAASPVMVRGRRRVRARLVVEAGGSAIRWDLPTWAGSREFGTVRPDGAARTSLVQGALLAKDEITVEEAITPEDLRAAREMSYATYVEENEFVDPAVLPLSKWADEFDEHSIILVARAGGMLAGTIRLVRETEELGLPHQKWSPADRWPRREGARVEAGRLAVSRAYRPDMNVRLGVATLLISSGFERCLEEGADRVVMAAKLDHERFYRAIGFRPVSEPFRHGLNDVVVRLFEMDLHDPACTRRFVRLQGRISVTPRKSLAPATPASGIHVRPVDDGPGEEGAANAKTFTAFRDAEPAGTVRVITGAGIAHAGAAPNADDAAHEGTALMRLWVDPGDPDPDRVVSSLLSTVGSHLARHGAVHALAMVDPRLQPSLERLGFHGDGPSAGGGRVLLHALCWDVAALRRAEPQGPDAGRLVFLADRESLVESAGPLGSVYEVVRGGLDLQELQDDGRTTIVGRLGRGDRFGAPDAAPHRTRTAVARGDCEIRVLSEPTVVDYARSGRGREVPREDTSARGPAGVGVRLFNEALAARVVWALHEIGVFRHVEPGALFEPAEVAASLRAVPELVIASLRFLARSGLAREEGGRYAVYPETLRSLRREMGLLEWLLGGYAPVLTALPRLLGGGVRYGEGVLRDDAQMALASATISRELTDPDLFEELRFQGVRTVADVGCGSALRLIEVCRQLPYVTGVGVDISAECCHVARANVAKAGLGSRIDVVESDAAEWLRTLRRDSSTPPDLLMCCAMFHDLASRPGKAEEFLAEARQTLQSGRTLLIQDQNRLPDDAAADDSWGAGFELIHHVMGQRLFLRAEYEALFARSGWKVTRRIETPIREGWIYLLEPAGG